MKTKKIIKTLKFIKNYCKNTDCNECIFYGGGCELYQTPHMWGIKNIKENVKCIDEVDEF